MSSHTVEEISNIHPGLQYHVRSETNRRDNNEDSYLVFTLSPVSGSAPLTVLAVADGMGGLAHGEFVSREAVRRVSLSLFEQLVVEPSLNCNETVPRGEDFLKQALLNALEQANSFVQKMVSVNKWGKAGSTIVIAIISGDNVVAANLGDSPLFHYQAREKALAKITEDHTVACTLVKARLLTPEMARYHSTRSQLQYYLGCPHLPDKEDAPVYQAALAPGDLLLLCSDGVNGSLLHEQIDAVFSGFTGELADLADHLLEAALKEGETDNQTLILWRQPDSSAEGLPDGEDRPVSPLPGENREETRKPALKLVEPEDKGEIGARGKRPDRGDAGKEKKESPGPGEEGPQSKGTASDTLSLLEKQSQGKPDHDDGRVQDPVFGAGEDCSGQDASCTEMTAALVMLEKEPATPPEGAPPDSPGVEEESPAEVQPAAPAEKQPEPAAKEVKPSSGLFERLNRPAPLVKARKKAKGSETVEWA